jgi:phage-related protein
MPSLIEFMHLMYTPLTGLARLFLTLLVPAVSGASKQIRDASASVQEFTAWLGNIRDSVGETSQKVAGAFASIRGAVEGAFANIGNWLRDSGKSLIQGFINGINDKIADAKGAVSNVLDKVRNLFPFSPAKEGPFSGRGWVRYSGQSISTALAQGIRERTPLARTAALDLVSAAHPGANGLIAAAAAYTGPSNGAAGVGSSSAAPAVELSGTFYSYDLTALLAEAQKKARDKQAVAQLRTITRAR